MKLKQFILDQINQKYSHLYSGVEVQNVKDGRYIEFIEKPHQLTNDLMAELVASMDDILGKIAKNFAGNFLVGTR